MSRSVPLGRRNLFSDRRRAALSVLGVAVALLLVLVLDGIFAGAMRQVTAYLTRSPADVFVSQRGVRTMHMSQSSLPAEEVQAVRNVPGVAWAEGIRFATTVVRSRTGRQLSYVIGYETATGRGGPATIASGRAPRSGEAVIDRVGASELRVGVGDQIRIGDVRLRVSGLSTDGTSITNTTTFVTAPDFARLRGSTVSYVLAGATPGLSATALARRVRTAIPQTTVQTRREFVGQEARIVRDMSADIMAVMSIVGFLIALAVIGLTLFTSTLSKLREYGVAKALGMKPGRLIRIVLSQGAWLVGAGLILAVGLAFIAGAGVAALTPNVRIVIGPSSVARAAAGGLVVGLLGSMVPLVRVLRVDPASVFRGP